LQEGQSAVGIESWMTNTPLGMVTNLAGYLHLPGRLVDAREPPQWTGGRRAGGPMAAG